MTVIMPGMVHYTLDDGVTVFQVNDVDEFGASWLVDSEEGWTDTPSVRVESVDRPAVDGADVSAHIYGSRVVALRGRAFLPSLEAVRTAQRTLPSLMASGTRSATLTVDDGHQIMAVTARLFAPVKTRLLSPLVLEWEIELLAPDPIKYGPETVERLDFPTVAPGDGLQYPLAYPLDYGASATSSQEVFIPNAGTVPLWLRLRIDGPVTNPRVYVAETGAELRFNLTVTDGNWLDVLCRDRRVLANGVASRRFAVTYSQDWLAIPPGGATLGWDSDDQDPAAQLWVWAPEGAWI